MRRTGLFLACLLVAPSTARGADPSEILKFLPRQAELAIVVERPRQLIDAVRTFEPVRQLYQFDALKEQLSSTNFRRFEQLLAYYEKALGRHWPELVEKLAGGGAALGLQFDTNPPTSLLAVRATDEALLHKAFGLVVDVIKSELERTESTEKVQTHSHRGITGYQFGNDVFAAVVGPVLLVGNKAAAIHAGIDLHVNGDQESLLRLENAAKTQAMLPDRPLIWLYGNLKRVQANPDSKDTFGYPKQDPGQIVIFQGMTDVSGRSPYVGLGLYATDGGFRASLRMPAGRNATPAGLATHFPESGAATLPLLEPKNVLFSTSFYLDVAKIWTERERLLEGPARKNLEEADKKLARFLAGRKFADILTSVGPYHRVVAVARDNSGYKVQPEQLQPAVAVVSSLRNPAYSDAMNAVLRTVALVAGAQFKLKYKEEKIGNVTLVTYRFPEDGKFEGDPERLRFNISPCFAKVGDQFLVASTVELGREMVALLQEPGVNRHADATGDCTTRTRVYAEGGAALLHAFEEQLLTATILDRAISTDDARREARALVEWVRQLGRVDLATEYGPDVFRLDVNYKWAGAKP